MTLIKSFSVGNGDMFYIEHDSDNFTIIDCCLNNDNNDDIIDEIYSKQRKKGIRRFISTHPDEDHIRGLDRLDEKISINNFYCVKNQATKDDVTDSFDKYCELRDSNKAFYINKGCTRKWMNNGSEERGSSGISILWPDTANKNFKEALNNAKDGASPNNISPIIKYSQTDGVKALWMGDLETAFMEAIAEELNIPKIDILFAPHHGRDSGRIPASILEKMSPKIIIIGEAKSGHLHYYPDYNKITQNLAGDIYFDCVNDFVHIYVSNDSYSVKFLENHKQPNKHGYYIGSLEVN